MLAFICGVVVGAVLLVVAGFLLVCYCSVKVEQEIEDEDA